MCEECAICDPRCVPRINQTTLISIAIADANYYDYEFQLDIDTYIWRFYLRFCGAEGHTCESLAQHDNCRRRCDFCKCKFETNSKVGKNKSKRYGLRSRTYFNTFIHFVAWIISKLFYNFSLSFHVFVPVLPQHFHLLFSSRDACRLLFGIMQILTAVCRPKQDVKWIFLEVRDASANRK